MLIVFVALAILSAFIGLLSLSQATLGVGFLALACLLGIFARIAQAASHARAQAVVRDTPSAFTGPTRICPRCGDRIAADAGECPLCRALLPKAS